MLEGGRQRTFWREDARTHVEVVRFHRVGGLHAFADAARNGLRDAADLLLVVDVDRAGADLLFVLRRVGRLDRDGSDGFLGEVALRDDELDRAAEVLLAG